MENQGEHDDHNTARPRNLRRHSSERWQRLRGPCNTCDKDAGSGPTPGATGQSITTGSAETKAHPPTDTMNREAGNKAMSAQDAQRQQQGQPTAAQQTQGAKPSAKMADEGC
jgi:hypothetical protein